MGSTERPLVTSQAAAHDTGAANAELLESCGGRWKAEVSNGQHGFSCRVQLGLELINMVIACNNPIAP